MRPSTNPAYYEKGEVIEDRGGVRVIANGGFTAWVTLEVSGDDKPIKVCGVAKGLARAELERKRLNPHYKPPDPNDKLAAAFAEPEKVWLGKIEGLRYRIPLGLVLDLMGDKARKVDALRMAKSTVDLQQRMRASDGDCSPVIFLRDEHSGDLAFFEGSATVAAAMGLDMKDVPVIAVRSSDASGVQSYLATRLRPPPPTDPDDIYWRISASA